MGDGGGAVEPLFSMSGHLFPVQTVCFHPCGNVVLSGCCFLFLFSFGWKEEFFLKRMSVVLLLLGG